MTIELTEDQKKAIEIAKKRYYDEEEYTVISGYSGTGKALPNYMEIPTPIGKRKVGEIKVGDYLFDREGKPTKVLGVFPQKEKQQVYKIVFKDGREVECSGDHLWTYYFKSHGKIKQRTEKTKDLLQRSIERGGFKSKTSSGYFFSLSINEPAIYQEKEYSIDPYVLGLFLGDGSFRQNILSFSTADVELVELISEKTGWSYKKNSQFNYNWSFYYPELIDGGFSVRTRLFLKDYPELINIKSENKFIPEEYLYGSIEQRYDLLAGLLDTDGTVDKKGRIRFCNTSKKLIDQIVNLCYSLGFVTSVSKISRHGYGWLDCYDIHIQCKPKDKLKLFKLTRKRKRVEEWLNNGKIKQYKKFLGIKNIEILDKYENMTCFLVDNEEHLFLCKDYIVTHNTTAVSNLVEELGLDKREEVAYISYTGRAALVLQEKGCPNAQTAHKLLYHSIRLGNGRYYHKPKKELDKDYKLIIVDEVSMLPMSMWKLLMKHKIHVVALGDPFQLPCVNREEDNHLLENPHIKLTKIMRQALDNDIIEISMKIRNGEKLPKFYDGKNVRIIPKKDFTRGMMRWADQMICATNKTRHQINRMARDSLGLNPDHAEIGDKIICLRNYWDIMDWQGDEPLINGTIGFLTKKVEMWSKVLWQRKIYLSNMKTLNNKEFADLLISKEILENKELPIEPKRLSKRERDLMDLEFDYGYCISCWKAQGSEFSKVLVFEEPFPYDPIEHQRYLYTALTRARDKALIIV